MKVKIGDKVYDADNEPILIILNNKDKENITNMLTGKMRYLCFPDSLSWDDKMQTWAGVNLIGLRGEDYHLNKGIIVDQATFETWQLLKPYDESGWLCDNAPTEYEMKPTDILVAFENDDGDTNVFTYQNGGVTLITK
jgi:hypothetical protein